jgi:predicted nucleic acid-binding Zn ribbon protein
MSFKPLDDAIRSLVGRPGWEDYRRYARVVAAWEQVVPPRLVSRTRPFSLQKGVLSVATASAPLAAELSLQRHALLTGLARHLDEPLEDIRFSSARWHDRPPVPPAGALPHLPIERHPSHVERDEGATVALPSPSPRPGLERWRQRLDRRASSWPLCPRCQSPTPAGEIERWGACAFCSVRDPGDRR